MRRLDPIDAADIKASVRKVGEKRLIVAAALAGGYLARGMSDEETLSRSLALADRLINQNMVRTQQDVNWALEDARKRLARYPERRGA